MNLPTDSADGTREIRDALAESRRLFGACALFSVFVNLLMLTGPLFMLQVYDRVLSSRSEATLVTLLGIVAFLFLIMGLLDYARGRVLARAGARMQIRLDDRVLRAVLARSVSPAERAQPAAGPADLESLQRFAASSAPFALFDAPWTPIFLAVLFVFHWTLGLLAVGSGTLLVVIALIGQKRTAHLQDGLRSTTQQSAFFVEQMRAGGETVQGLGMTDAVIRRSRELRGQTLAQTLTASDRVGLFTSSSRTLRLFLQSAMLGLGAWLAIRGQISPGLMIAASILLGRALAPIDQAIGQWPATQRALASYRSLASLLAHSPPPVTRTSLPQPRALLEARNVIVAPPGARYATVRGASLRLEPGNAVGIAGPSASGKSTFARALAGVWFPANGSIRLDGAELDQYGTDIGLHIGYLPQEVVLFDGTVAQNIARMSADALDEDIVDAAKRTGAHEMILRLPDGYDFRVAAGGAALSGGQRQRIALARAFYGSPAVIVMDEPDSNLDAEGTMALARAVEGHKQRGGAALIVAHRHGAFNQCDTVYIMENGRPVPASSLRPSQAASPVRSLQAADGDDAASATGPDESSRAPTVPEADGDETLSTLPTRTLERIDTAIARLLSGRHDPSRSSASEAAPARSSRDAP